MQWQYQTIHFPTSGGIIRDATVNTDAFDQALNLMGNVGWELVSMVGIQSTNGKTDTVIATLKRPQGAHI
jgi:hypothetical protein